jgi:hypothetical protein
VQQAQKLSSMADYRLPNAFSLKEDIPFLKTSAWIPNADSPKRLHHHHDSLLSFEKNNVSIYRNIPYLCKNAPGSSTFKQDF